MTNEQGKTYSSRKSMLVKSALLKAVGIILLLLIIALILSDALKLHAVNFSLAILSVGLPFMIVVMLVYGIAFKTVNVTVDGAKVTFWRKNKMLDTIDLDNEHVKPLIENSNQTMTASFGLIGALLSGSKRYLIVTKKAETGLGIRAASVIKSKRLHAYMFSKEDFADLVSDIEGYYAMTGQLKGEEEHTELQNEFKLPKKEMVKKVIRSGIIATIVLAVLGIAAIVAAYILAPFALEIALLFAVGLVGVFWLCYSPRIISVNGKSTPELIAFTNSALHIDDKSYEWDRITFIKATPANLEASAGMATRRKIVIATDKSKITYNFGLTPPPADKPSTKPNVFVYDDYQSLVARLYQAMAPYGAKIKSDL